MAVDMNGKFGRIAPLELRHLAGKKSFGASSRCEISARRSTKRIADLGAAHSLRQLNAPEIKCG
jgi:hypothetical protein